MDEKSNEKRRFFGLVGAKMNREEFLEEYDMYRTDTFAEAVKERDIVNERLVGDTVVVVYFKELKEYTISLKWVAEDVVRLSPSARIIKCYEIVDFIGREKR